MLFLVPLLLSCLTSTRDESASAKYSDSKKVPPEKVKRANKQWHSSITGIACRATLTIRPSYCAKREAQRDTPPDKRVRQDGHRARCICEGFGKGGGGRGADRKEAQQRSRGSSATRLTSRITITIQEHPPSRVHQKWHTTKHSPLRIG